MPAPRKAPVRQTQCRREMDSNHRSPARKSRFLLRKANCGTERGQPKKVVSYAVPMGRIHLPPPESLRTIGPSTLVAAQPPRRREGPISTTIAIENALLVKRWHSTR